MTGRRSSVPLLDRTSRQPTSGASATTVCEWSRWRGWRAKRTTGPAWGRSTTSTSQACRVDDRAPVSTLALMASTPRSGSVTHSRQPMVGVIIDWDAIRHRRDPTGMARPAPVPPVWQAGRMAAPAIERGDAGGLRAAPPRWTFGIAGPRLRVSVGLLAWLALSVWLLGLSPGWLGRVGPAALVVAMMGSMLAHQGAHAVAAHKLGYRVEWIVLGGLAGVTAYFGRDDRPLDRAAVALAGPAASAVLVLVGNLLPIAGTDGARTFGGVTEHVRNLRARRSR